MSKSRNFFLTIGKIFKCLYERESHREIDLESIVNQEQKIFTFEALIAATEKFSLKNKLGEGGFGAVYKGRLTDGREIAVKKLSYGSKQGNKEFMNEAKLLTAVQHRNVVNLHGYCIHGEEKLLVYEYLMNKSLDQILFDSKLRKQFDWNNRFDVIMGVARGLLYLHEDAHTCLVHRDIKPSNILLDDKWAPKIADFGMARLFPEDQTHVNSHLAGTRGYMAPEYVKNGKLSVMVDVFSFGVLVLELVTAKKNSAFMFDPNFKSLIEWVWVHYTKGLSLDVMDPALASSADAMKVEMCIKIGLLCTQLNPKQRPSMQRVVILLSKKHVILEEPMEPAYVSRSSRRHHRHGFSSSESSHTSDVGLTYSTNTKLFTNSNS